MYQEANKSFNFLFSKPEREPRKMVKDINNLMGKYQDCRHLKRKLIEKYGDETFDVSYLNELIDRLNSNENKDETRAIIKEILNIPNVLDVYFPPTGDYKVTIEQGEIYFTDIEHFIEKINSGEKSQDLKDYLKKVSSIIERMSHCHSESINLAILLERDFGIPSNVVTGHPSYFVSKNRYLHSWNELNIDGKEYVIDSTMNTCINKEGYYLLRNIAEKENVSSIPSKVIVDDFKNHIDFIEEIDLKTYLTSRNELMTEYLKKNHLLKKSKEGDER